MHVASRGLEIVTRWRLVKVQSTAVVVRLQEIIGKPVAMHVIL